MSETTMKPPAHTTVLLDEAVAALKVHEGGIYVDATFGGGGHTRNILEHSGTVIAFDQDERAIALADTRLKEDEKLTLLHSNFSALSEKLNELAIDAVDGILFDLGTSAMQLEGEGRGFSFNQDEPLDMRMSDDLQVSAKDLIHALGKKELHVLFEKYAQEKRSRAIADAIVRARKVRPIETTGQLAEIIWGVYRRRIGRLHPATKVFQALRIAVNDELNVLQAALPDAVRHLKRGGRIVVISFHEGEDRIVKQTFEQLEEIGALKKITRKPETPSESELQRNPRARSAKMRIGEKV